MRLAAMMGLVVEHVRHQSPRRLGRGAGFGDILPGEVACQPVAGEAGGPTEDGLVEGGALGFQLVPIAVVWALALIVFGGDGRGACKPAHPDSVGPEDMRERGVQRAEERSPVYAALVVR